MTRELSRINPQVTVSDFGDWQDFFPSSDSIRIEELELSVRVGVPEEERAQPQRLSVSVTLHPVAQFGDLNDDLARTVDYGAVCAELQSFARGRADRLIETLADRMAEHLLQLFPLLRVELELRKFVLPETRYVAVKVARERKPAR
ncbi:hypothetical protein BH20VER3_BH20VER3_09200 [soil metagenome]